MFIQHHMQRQDDFNAVSYSSVFLWWFMIFRSIFILEFNSTLFLSLHYTTKSNIVLPMLYCIQFLKKVERAVCLMIVMQSRFQSQFLLHAVNNSFNHRNMAILLCIVYKLLCSCEMQLRVLLNFSSLSSMIWMHQGVKYLVSQADVRKFSKLLCSSWESNKFNVKNCCTWVKFIYKKSYFANNKQKLGILREISILYPLKLN